MGRLTLFLKMNPSLKTRMNMLVMCIGINCFIGLPIFLFIESSLLHEYRGRYDQRCSFGD